jgi:hypothetical protein
VSPLKHFPTDDTEFQSTLDHNPQVQACRKDAMAHPEKYPDAANFASMGGAYHSVIDQPTKDFMTSIINGLN